MTLLTPSSRPSDNLSLLEWEELDELRLAISHSPTTVVVEQQERFTALFVRSIFGKGDRPLE
jgi:hypothetical protein